MKKLEGQLIKFLYGGENNGGFAVAVLKDATGEEHKIVGSILGKIGDSIVVEGEEGNHPKFGRQFKVKNSSFGELGRDAAAIIDYLDRLPNVGPVRAHTIYRNFKEKTFEVIEHEPHRLAEAPGITARMVAEIHEAFMAEKNERDLIVFLKKFRLTDHRIGKIIKIYGPDAKRVITQDPYRMIIDIDGFGFKTVDEIAQAAGLARTDEKRIEAGLIWILQDHETQGHTCLPSSYFVDQGCQLLQVPRDLVISVAKKMIDLGRDIVHDEETKKVYLVALQRAEVMVAQAIMALKEKTETLFDEGGEHA